jgi:hypothetical protein
VANGSPCLRFSGEGAAPEVTRQRLCPAFAGSFNERRLANDEIDRNVGEDDAIRRTGQVEANAKE